nr:hypothetical protein [Tanacetum cinerariifolium]
MGNHKRKENGGDGPEWVVRNKFEEKIANFMLENKLHTNGIGEMFDQHYLESALETPLFQLYRNQHLRTTLKGQLKEKDPSKEAFREAMIHIPKGCKVLKDLLSDKEKLEKAAS